MKTYRDLLKRRLTVALTLFGLAAGSLLSTQAVANTAADTTILNVVRVDYKDASKTASFAATASTTVTVNLVEAALTISAPVDQTVASGAIATYLYTLTATANGSDVYDVVVSLGATANVAGAALTHRTLAADGTTQLVASPADVTLGASVITAAPAANQLTFPGGTLTNIGVGDVVVVGGNSFIVAGVTLGSGASHTNLGAVAQTAIGVDTAEVNGSLTLAIHPAGSNVAPAFAAGNVGTVAAEQVFLEVTSTATTTGTTDGTVIHTVETDSVAGGAPASGLNNYASATNTTTFTGTSLSITKEVQNLNDAVPAFGATATGNPGDILEYRVTVINGATGGDAADVVVTDTVPAYTALVVTGVNFATITDGTNTVTLTTTVDSEVQPGVGTEVGFGDATVAAAGSPINFYVGTTSTNATGGVVATSTTYTILYQVQIQ